MNLLDSLTQHALSPASHALAVLPRTLSLLSVHSPLSPNSAGAIPPSSLAAFLKLVDGYVSSKETESRIVGWTIAAAVVDQSRQTVLESHGRAWVTSLIPLVGKPIAPQLVEPLVRLLSTIFLASPSLPAFHREVAVPWLQKYALGLVAWADKGEGLTPILATLPELASFHPPSFRPLHPSLLSLSLTHLLTPALHSSASHLYTVLHLLHGKSSISASYSTDLVAALSSSHAALSAITSSIWQEEALLHPISPEADIKFKGWDGKDGDLKRERDGLVRISRATERLRGLVGVVCRMLRVKGERPVALQVGEVLQVVLRIWKLSDDGLTVAHVDPTELAQAQSLLPELYMLGCALIGQLCLCVKQHLLPHEAQIKSYLIFLLESSSSQPHLHLTLLNTLHLVSTHLEASPAPSSASLLSRTVKICLANLSVLMEDRSALAFSTSSSGINGAGSGGGKGKGKKRGHGSTGDGVLESAPVPVSTSALHAAVTSVGILSLAMRQPALPSSIRTLATRILLSLAMSLPARRLRTGEDGVLLSKVESAVSQLLADGLCGGAGSASEGTIGGEAAWVVATSTVKSRRGLAQLFHPLLPALPRPIPSAASLFFFKSEGKDELAARRELGLGTDADDALAADADADEPDAMDVEPSTSGVTAALAPLSIHPAAPPPTVAQPSLFEFAPVPTPSTLPTSPATFDAPPTDILEDALDPMDVPPPTHSSTSAPAPLTVAGASAAPPSATSASTPTSKLWADQNAEDQEDSDGEIPEIDMGSSDDDDNDEDDE